ncbi:hypothetical protein WMY93_004890 [Mugilogobius chulae]|uniref:Secreted protein n=1 Tax=Mugilogobius chulae TaxID=88201 RepID=A0AAW0PYB3_9GOBI
MLGLYLSVSAFISSVCALLDVCVEVCVCAVTMAACTFLPRCSCLSESSPTLKGSMKGGDSEPIIFSLMVPRVQGRSYTTKRLRETSIRGDNLGTGSARAHQGHPGAAAGKCSAERGETRGPSCQRHWTRTLKANRGAKSSAVKSHCQRF